MKTFTKCMAAVFGCLVAVSLAACGGQPTPSGQGGTADTASYTTVEDGKLIALSDLAFPPMDFIPAGATAEDCEGYEVALVNAIADKLGLTPEWHQVKFDTIIPQIVQGGHADIGASSFTVTDERKEEIDFTETILDSNQGVVMAASAQTNLNDVSNPQESDLNQESVKVAVQSGTTGEAWAQENLPKATLVPLDDVIECLNGLQAGTYQVCVADLPVVSYMCANGYSDLKIVAEEATGEQYAIVVSKDNPGLTEAINKAYQELVDDGTVAKLQEEWFGGEL